MEKGRQNSYRGTKGLGLSRSRTGTGPPGPGRLVRSTLGDRNLQNRGTGTWPERRKGGVTEDGPVASVSGTAGEVRVDLFRRDLPEKSDPVRLDP